MYKTTAASKPGSAVTEPNGRKLNGTTPISPSQALGLVIKELNRTKLADQTTQKVTEIIVRFTIYVEKGHGIRSVCEIAEEHVEGFVFASFLGRSERRRPSPATMHLRRSALRLHFRILRQIGAFVGDPTLDLVLPPRSCMAVRPLTDDEIALCRGYSLHTLTETRQPAAWALAEATARTSEIPHVRLSDLDLSNGRVWLHGSNKTQERWGSLTEWARTQLERRLRRLKALPNEDRLIVYEGSGSEQSRQASSCIAIAETLNRAGLVGEPDVRPGSVALWAGRKTFEETGDIDEVALRLGVQSLDRAADLIGWKWADRREPK